MKSVTMSFRVKKRDISSAQSVVENTQRHGLAWTHADIQVARRQGWRIVRYEGVWQARTHRTIGGEYTRLGHFADMGSDLHKRALALIAALNIMDAGEKP